MTIFLTILAGVTTFVLGQIFLRLLVEPVHELKRTISDIAVALIQHANVYCNPGVAGEDKEREVAWELRSLASRLNAQMYLVPAYSKIHGLFGLPASPKILQAMRHLIGISNGVHKTNVDMATTNGEKSDKICDLLGVKVPNEDHA